MDEVLWRPDAAAIADSQLAAFAEAAGQPLDMAADDGGYDALWRWSIEERADFWGRIWNEFGVVGDRGVEEDAAAASGVLGADAMPGARWFEDARLNFAENLLHGAGVRDGATAILTGGEGVRRRRMTFGALREEVARVRAALLLDGVGEGDVVAGWLPNGAEAVVVMLAASSIGAIWTSCSPDFGVEGVLDRFGQVKPKVLIACEDYPWKGRTIDIFAKLEEVQPRLPGLIRTVVLRFYGRTRSTDQHEDRDLSRFPWATDWRDWLEAAPPQRLEFAQLRFDHPLYIMFSSGTTGKPKCIVHGQGGTLLQHLKEHRLHCNLRPQEKVLYFTTTGWMMWNWLVSALASGCAIVLVDGNPFQPVPDAMWRMIADEGIEVFGTSAKYLDACRKEGMEPGKAHDLRGLRLLMSTGSPLVPEAFDWVYEQVGAQIQLASITGGTDLISCFALGCPIVPVRRGELQVRGLGMAVEIWNDDGQAVVGEPGELVCTASFPSMPVGFFGDDDGSRYHAAYFERFPGIWHHGDWCELTEHRGIVVYGRSDATLNPGGVRIGTAEIYRQVEGFDAVQEAVVIGQDTGDGDQRVVLFVRMRDGQQLDGALKSALRSQIKTGASPRHVPRIILAVDDIPRTRSGKISELAVRDVVHGRPVKNSGALANPEALQCFEGRPELLRPE